MTSPQSRTADGRPRARALGIAIDGVPGPLNAITDIAGIEVGVTTLISGDGPLPVGRDGHRSSALPHQHLLDLIRPSA